MIFDCDTKLSFSKNRPPALLLHERICSQVFYQARQFLSNSLRLPIKTTNEADNRPTTEDTRPQDRAKSLLCVALKACPVEFASYFGDSLFRLRTDELTQA